MSQSERSECKGPRPIGISRRGVLRVGALTMTGLGLPELLQLRVNAQAGTLNAGFGRARACILIFQWGGPSQLDTWDPKPDAPAEIRGEFGTIATTIPGLRISEHFPLLARQTHRMTIVRSMTHDDPAHLSTAHRLLTGHLAPTPKSDAAGPSPSDWPHLGSLVARCRPSQGVLPSAVTMPWSVAHPAAPGGRAPGQTGGWLGKGFDPFAIEGDPNHHDFQVVGLGLPDGITTERMRGRRDLFENLRDGQAPPDRFGRAWDQFQAKALDALGSNQARDAFRVRNESEGTRDRYGRHIHGQSLLLARRLVEAGVGLVTVNWHNDGQNFWDTHGDNFNQLKNRLMPPADQGFSTLLDDLDARGLLDETLVVWAGEFGRTPRITPGNAGREHWPRCYSIALAGAGVAQGHVHGASDRWAAHPTRDPVSPDDLGATILHSLGIEPDTEVPNPLGRPMRINTGTPVTSIFS